MTDAHPMAIPAGACPCATCTPLPIRFIVCQVCGNKRCPKAEDHVFRCTGSNEPGQVGELESTYQQIKPSAQTAEDIAWAKEVFERDDLAAQIPPAVSHNADSVSPVSDKYAGYVECGCGDMFPPDSYGAGFIDGRGHCENCEAGISGHQTSPPEIPDNCTAESKHDQETKSPSKYEAADRAAWLAEAMRLADEYAERKAEARWLEDQGTKSCDIGGAKGAAIVARAALLAHLDKR